MQPQSFSICRNVVHSLTVCTNIISAEKVTFQTVQALFLKQQAAFAEFDVHPPKQAS